MPLEGEALRAGQALRLEDRPPDRRTAAVDEHRIGAHDLHGRIVVQHREGGGEAMREPLVVLVAQGE